MAKDWKIKTTYHRESDKVFLFNQIDTFNKKFNLSDVIDYILTAKSKASMIEIKEAL